VLICIVLATVRVSATAQVAPSATVSRLSLSAGAEGSMFQPDYAGQGVAQTSPLALYGMGAYFDARFTRWIQIEAEGRWLHWHEYAGINQNTYMIGPRIPIRTFRGITPYGKVLVGWASGSFLSGRTTALAYGGGVDYRLTPHFTLRAIDFEYQQYRVSPTIWPYGGSIGLSYKFF
jgi:opacity protein-like surface antigen